MDKKSIPLVMFAIILSCFVFFVDTIKIIEPKEAYHVYLHGESIGIIDSKISLENYINSKQTEIKEKYKVDNVYAPKDLDIVKEITYSNKRNTINEIYSIIKEKAPFTIEGYEITIHSVKEMTDEGDVYTDPVTINVLNKEVFSKAIENIVFVFVDKEKYIEFINNKQEKIEDVGTIVEDIYIENEITIKKSKVSTTDEIFTDSNILSQYLLFGTTNAQSLYTVKSGDTIEKVSYANKMSTEEFLIANPEFNSIDNLLYVGQKVVLANVHPAFKVVEEMYMVEVVTRKYDTTIIYDETLNEGVEYIKQKGVDGSDKVTKKVYTKNDQIYHLVTVAQEVIVPAIEEVIVVGTKIVPHIGNLKVWSWPTKKPYSITSYYGYRWGGVFHHGIDISGTGRGSPIYAANNGIVTVAEYNNYNGYYVFIDHNNGYTSAYGHMDFLTVKEGQIVASGQQIGGMGDTGFATGVHLHFSIYRKGKNSVNPLSFY